MDSSLAEAWLATKLVSQKAGCRNIREARPEEDSYVVRNGIHVVETAQNEAEYAKSYVRNVEEKQHCVRNNQHTLHFAASFKSL